MIAYLVTKARRTWAVEVQAKGNRKATARRRRKGPTYFESPGMGSH